MPEKPYVLGARQGTLAHRFAAGYRDGWQLLPHNPRDRTKNYAYGYMAGERDRELGVIRFYMWGVEDPQASRHRREDERERAI